METKKGKQKDTKAEPKSRQPPRAVVKKKNKNGRINSSAAEANKKKKLKHPQRSFPFGKPDSTCALNP